MASEKVVKAIDALWAMEGSSLLQRLAEAAAFVPISEADRPRAIEEMIEDERRHGQRLAELLDAFDATPGPRRVEASSAEMNYDELGTQIFVLVSPRTTQRDGRGACGTQTMSWCGPRDSRFPRCLRHWALPRISPARDAIWGVGDHLPCLEQRRRARRVISASPRYVSVTMVTVSTG